MNDRKFRIIIMFLRKGKIFPSCVYRSALISCLIQWVMHLSLLCPALGLELQENVIVNGNFDEPAVASTQYFNQSIPGWSCSKLCQIDNCQNRSIILTQANRVYANCSGHVLDLNSDKRIESVSQYLTLSTGTYILSLNYYYPFLSANRKQFFIYFNRNLIFTVSPQVTAKFQVEFFEQMVTAQEGTNNLTITMKGLQTDSVGFRFNNVSLRRVYDPMFQDILEYSLSNPVIEKIVSFTALRSVLGEALNMFINLDRLQFYIYHQRNYSYYSSLLLQNINILMSLKGTIVQSYLARILPDVIQKEESFINSLDYKLRYSDSDFIDKNSNGSGFIINNAALFVYSVPVALLLLLTFSLLFHLLYRFPVSRCLRRFSFAAAFLLMLCEGNIEQFAFYAFGEFRSFFSAEFKHKWVNSFILGFFFLVLWTAIALIPWLRYSHGRNVRHFLQQKKMSLQGLYNMAIDKGIVCIAFGTVHQTMLDVPNIQLLFLGIIQIVWLLTKVYFLMHNSYRCKIFIIFSILQGLLRICFQIACYLYSNLPEKQLFLNDQLIKSLIWVFLALWLCEFLFSLGYLIYEIYHNFTYSATTSVVQVFPLPRTMSERHTQKQSSIHKKCVIMNDFVLFTTPEDSKLRLCREKHIKDSAVRQFVHEFHIRNANKDEKETKMPKTSLHITKKKQNKSPSIGNSSNSIQEQKQPQQVISSTIFNP